MDSISPTPTRIRQLLWLFGGVGLLGAVLTVVVVSAGVRGASDWRVLLWSGSMLVMGALAFAYLVLWLGNARLLVGTGTLGYQDIFGRRHIWNASDVGEVVDTSIVYNRKRAPQRGIYFLGLDGRRLFALNPGAWSPASIDRLVEATGKAVQVRARPMSPAEFRQVYPRAMSWAGQHPSLGVGLIFIGAVLVAVGVTIASNGRQ